MSSRLKSLTASLLPTVMLTVIALTQLGASSYTTLGLTIVRIQTSYVVSLIPVIIIFLIIRRGQIASGVAIGFGISFFVTLFVLGMGL